MTSDTILINKNKLIASIVSIILFGLLLFFCVFYSILSPNKNIAEETNSIEIGFANSENTNVNNLDINSIARSTISENEKTDPSNNSINVVPKNSEASAESFRNQFLQNRGKALGVSNEGQNNDEGLNSQTSEGKSLNGLIPSGYFIKGNLNIDLIGRKIEIQPKLSNDTKEEGKVVVEIIVDKNGKVIKADPNGRGTTTSSSTLKEKAKQTALSTLFSTSNLEEQKGTITIIFSF